MSDDRCPEWPTIQDVAAAFLRIDADDGFDTAPTEDRLVLKVLASAEPALSYADLRKAGQLIRRYEAYLSAAS